MTDVAACIHAFAPHTPLSIYLSSACTIILALVIVLFRCWWNGSLPHLDEKWIIITATAAAPIPTYILLMLVPLDHDLATSMLEDRVVVALAGLYGVVEAVRDIGRAAKNAHRKKNGHH